MKVRNVFNHKASCRARDMLVAKAEQLDLTESDLQVMVQSEDDDLVGIMLGSEAVKLVEDYRAFFYNEPSDEFVKRLLDNI